MIKQVNYDWSKKFATMYIDTNSKFKNFIRGDWTQSAIDKKLEFNKNVDAMINRLYQVQSTHNTLIVEYMDYCTKYNITMNHLKEKEKDIQSLHSKFVGVQNRYSAMKSKVEDVKKSIESIPVYTEKTEIVDYNTGTIDKDIKKYQDKINRLTADINNNLKEIKGLNDKIHILELYLNKTFGTIEDKSNLPREYYEKKNEADSCRRAISQNNKNIESNFKRLSDIVKEIHSFNKKQFENQFRYIINWSKELIKENTNISEFIKQLRLKLKGHMNSEHNVVTSKNLASINKKLEDACSKFDSFQKMYDKKDYNTGFFRTLNTKKKTLREIDIKIDELDNLTKIIHSAFEGTKMDFDRFKNVKNLDKLGETNKKMDHLVENINQFEENLNQSKNRFIHGYSQIAPPILIKPIYGEMPSNDNKKIKCIRGVREGTISMPKI